jgi:hypothetical protein
MKSSLVSVRRIYRGLPLEIISVFRYRDCPCRMSDFWLMGRRFQVVWLCLLSTRVRRADR